MNPDIDVRHAIADKVYAQVGDWADLTYSSGRYAEFNPKGVNKGTATLKLGEYLGIKPDEIIAFGDNSNDLPMLRAVGMPVSVANGIDEVKDVAKYVTKADYNTGVAEAINKFVLSQY
jgi:hydroxymethylpyrimidine pyrophosphatase-like HAD family hydrolase